MDQGQGKPKQDGQLTPDGNRKERRGTKTQFWRMNPRQFKIE